MRVFVEDPFDTAFVKQTGLFKAGALSGFADAYYSRGEISGTQMWTLVTLMAWLNRWKPAL